MLTQTRSCWALYSIIYWTKQSNNLIYTYNIYAHTKFCQLLIALNAGEINLPDSTKPGATKPGHSKSSNKHAPDANLHKDDPILHFDLEKAAGFLLWQTSLLWQRRMEQALTELDLTHTQFIVLSGTQYLSDIKKQTVTQALLSQEARMDAMMVSQLVRKLEQKRFLKREAHPTDSRARTLVLSDYGLDTLAKARHKVLAAAEDFFGAEADQKILQQQLNQLYQRHKGAEGKL